MTTSQHILCVLLFVLKVHGVRVGFHTSTIGPLQHPEQENPRLRAHIPSKGNVGPLIVTSKESGLSFSPEPSEEAFEVLVSPSPETVENALNDELKEALEETLFLLPSSSPIAQFDITFEPSQSPEPFSGVSISVSSTGSSTILNGLTTPSNITCISVIVLVIIGTLISVMAITLYGRSINPYRPFITGASLSEDSLDFNEVTIPNIANDNVASRDASTVSRRYQALSLERDVGSEQHYEAARLLEEIPDRHRRPDQT
ncbi:hypothetical protein BWQ96_00145 [Gracilariopsis chorda]|uniref:Uncharacterized protein n=1 Tax=Gracilariopsis chorda TaxID=448386 RepID=A0A2V3J6F1_9FLOR|nr:hypothetical protein BWQ96_00145 [Gracilariopsis chorda]|eukprot:PXF49985.1 hypothetical protein BWQ96_00145 [Gracilariopsis chorda]